SRELKLPLHLVRKAGKLPRDTIAERYSLEYGDDELELHSDVILPGVRYAIIDDLIATGGTVEATVRLVQRAGGQVACCAFLIELLALEGRFRLPDVAVESVLQY
ncbi:MAG: purine phosphoribosyltransferase family protein, partial [Pseudomonadota bacterium]